MMQGEHPYINTDSDNTGAAMDQENEYGCTAEKVQVFVRLRPIYGGGAINDTMLGAKPKEDGRTIEVLSPKDGSLSSHSFDGVFGEISHKDLYQRTASHLIDAVRDGQNACLIAYGQTCTGKTYSLFGDSGNTSPFDCKGLEKEGIAQYLVKELMTDINSNSECPNKSADGDDIDDALLKQFPPVVMCSYVEIYQDKLRDLLASSDNGETAIAGRFKVSSPLELRSRASTGVVGGVDVSGAYWESCHEEEDVMKILRAGNQARSTSETSMNSASSRSHAIFTIKVLPSGCEPRYLYLVDLAGSELASKTNAMGQTMQEAKTINKSLAALGNVVRAVTQGRPHVPYRDSKLTRLLQEAIGGSSVTSIILTVSPMASDFSETMSTLRFGHRAKKVTNKKRLGDCDENEDMQHSTVMTASGKMEVKEHWGDDILKREEDADVARFDGTTDNDSMSSTDVAAGTTIVPSEPSFSDGASDEELSLFSSSTLSLEDSLRASMIDSSMINSSLDSVSLQAENKDNGTETLPVRPEHPKPERYSFNSPSIGSNTSNSAFVSKKQQPYVSQDHYFNEGNDADEVFTASHSSALDDAQAQQTQEDDTEVDAAKMTHNADSYFNVGRKLFDNDKSEPSRSTVEVKPPVARKFSRNIFRATAFLGTLVFSSAVWLMLDRNGENEKESELDYCPAFVTFPISQNLYYHENATNFKASATESVGRYTNSTNDPHVPGIETTEDVSVENLPTALTAITIVFCLGTFIGAFARKTSLVTLQEHGCKVSDSDVLSSLTKPTLKDILQKKNMKVSGTKQDLIDRLCGSVNDTCKTHDDICKTPTPLKRKHKEDLSELTVSVLKTKLREKGLKLSGTKTDLFLRLKLADDSSDLTKSEMKEMLRKKGLKLSGKKADLADRLVQANY